MNPRVTIKPDGPILMSGPLELVDPAGHTHMIPAGRVVALCRCGQSNTKPYCDATHKTCGFKSSAPAPLR